MVYKPLRTDFLAAGEAAGGEAVDGLVMLIGQARAAFELFFSKPAPEVDRALRDILTG
jgi:shikimate dehydrogenase